MTWERSAAARMPSAATSRPLYLHFLDRELVEAAGAQLRPAVLQDCLTALTLGTSVSMYCGISVIWEHTLLDDASRQILAMLVEAGAIRPVSYSATVEEFFASRIELYRHDAARYPLYFQDGIDAVRSIVASDYKAERTTDHLVAALGAWSLGRLPIEAGAANLARAKTLQALGQRENEAITFAYFAPFLRAGGERVHEAETLLRQQISHRYADHYLSFSDGDIPTGVAGLGLFDQMLAKSFPAYDVRLLTVALQSLGFDDLLRAPILQRCDEWQAVLQLRGFGLHARLAALVRSIIWIGWQSAVHEDGPAGVSALRHRIGHFLSRFVRAADLRSRDRATIESRLEAAEAALAATIGRLSRVPALSAYVEMSRHQFLDYGADVLLVTATEVETRAVLEVLPSDHGTAMRRHYVGDKTYFDVGQIAGAQVYLVQTEMGSGGPSGSILAVSEGITALQPTSVVLVGIAFGAGRPGQAVGDILISRQVLCFDLQRVGSQAGRRRIVLRGDRVSASPRLLDRCRTAVLDWHGDPVHFGLLLSGDKVIDDQGFRDELVDLAGGEALGGEMEGSGLYASAHRRKVDWIIIKAICDWADGEKDVQKAQRQRLAAANAAKFTSHLLGRGGLV